MPSRSPPPSPVRSRPSLFNTLLARAEASPHPSPLPDPDVRTFLPRSHGEAHLKASLETALLREHLSVTVSFNIPVRPPPRSKSKTKRSRPRSRVSHHPRTARTALRSDAHGDLKPQPLAGPLDRSSRFLSQAVSPVDRNPGTKVIPQPSRPLTKHRHTTLPRNGRESTVLTRARSPVVIPDSSDEEEIRISLAPRSANLDQVQLISSKRKRRSADVDLALPAQVSRRNRTQRPTYSQPPSQPSLDQDLPMQLLERPSPRSAKERSPKPTRVSKTVSPPVKRLSDRPSSPQGESHSHPSSADGIVEVEIVPCRPGHSSTTAGPIQDGNKGSSLHALPVGKTIAEDEDGSWLSDVPLNERGHGHEDDEERKRPKPKSLSSFLGQDQERLSTAPSDTKRGDFSKWSTSGQTEKLSEPQPPSKSTRSSKSAVSKPTRPKRESFLSPISKRKNVQSPSSPTRTMQNRIIEKKAAPCDGRPRQLARVSMDMSGALKESRVTEMSTTKDEVQGPTSRKGDSMMQEDVNGPGPSLRSSPRTTEKSSVSVGDECDAKAMFFAKKQQKAKPVSLGRKISGLGGAEERGLRGCDLEARISVLKGLFSPKPGSSQSPLREKFASGRQMGSKVKALPFSKVGSERVSPGGKRRLFSPMKKVGQERKNVDRSIGVFQPTRSLSAKLRIRPTGVPEGSRFCEASDKNAANEAKGDTGEAGKRVARFDTSVGKKGIGVDSWGGEEAKESASRTGEGRGEGDGEAKKEVLQNGRERLMMTLRLRQADECINKKAGSGGSDGGDGERCGKAIAGKRRIGGRSCAGRKKRVCSSSNGVAGVGTERGGVEGGDGMENVWMKGVRRAAGREAQVVRRAEGDEKEGVQGRRWGLVGRKRVAEDIGLAIAWATDGKRASKRGRYDAGAGTGAGKDGTDGTDGTGRKRQGNAAGLGVESDSSRNSTTTGMGAGRGGRSSGDEDEGEGEGEGEGPARTCGSRWTAAVAAAVEGGSGMGKGGRRHDRADGDKELPVVRRTPWDGGSAEDFLDIPKRAG